MKTSHLVAAAVLAGILIGGLLVYQLKVCPQPTIINTYEADSLRSLVIGLKLEADGAITRANEAEEIIRELRSRKQPTKTRVQNEIRYHSSSSLEQLDSLLWAEPED